MDVEWSVEAGVDDPVIVVPWSGLSSSTGELIRYLDIKANPGAINELEEAKAWPEVRQILTILNGLESPVWTAKCDAWMLDEDELQLDFGPVAFGFGLYVDVFVDRQSDFAALTALQLLVQQWAELARRLAPDEARVDFIIRPAQLQDETGFAISTYIFGYGRQATEARKNWGAACAAVATLVASTDDTMIKRASSSIG
jgi:hypothetical protein